ncbi:MAG: hypothetical protein IJ219_08715 [Bacteroidaceae bacterium]|nr:hypothetical protein [Bacteroidaceae bacterium]MBQ9294986.1 hypothetical protein [Bacteroidaceae bacterium]
MKRLHYSLASLLIMMSALFLSSCRDMDTDQSMALSGQWRGDFGMFYDYIDGHGRTYTFDSYDTRLTFVPAYDYATYGRGTQVDYYDYGPYEYQYYKFSWEIRNGYIYLTYDYDHQLDVRISNYRMTNDYFSGVFSNSGTRFNLRKMVDFYNWTPYVNIYGYRDRNNWDYDYPYYAPYSRSDAEAPADTVQVEGSVARRGRR